MVRLAMGTRHSSPAGGARGPSLAFAFAPLSALSAAPRLNLNSASEEELMTLDGFDRTTARNVVEHRRRIGRFRRVEDLALVVGAERVQALRSEVCVSTSSRSASRDSLGSVESRAAPRRQVDVNGASVFELQKVRGVTQEVAAAIVHRREKRGPFRRLDDLLKVKGVDRITLRNIAMYLTVDGVSDAPKTNGDITKTVLSNGYTMPKQSKPELGPPRRSLPLRNGLSTSTESDIFELLSAYSPRPAAPRLEPGLLRLSSWNLHEFTYDKASNPGVREVICRTLLENAFSIVAVQGVENATALRTVCDELNKPTLLKVKEWRDTQHYWNFCMTHRHDSKLGFIYDSDGAFEVELISLRDGPADLRRHCDSIVASFRIDELKVELYNLSMREGADAASVGRRLDDSMDEEEPALVFVDLADGGSPPTVGSLSPAIPPGAATSLPGGGGRPRSAVVLRNARAAAGCPAGGVVTRGLTHMAIPNGWTWGGPVSPYCPLWAELRVRL